MSEEIRKFVSENEGCSFTELTTYFEGKLGWSHGKFMNHFNKARNTHIYKQLVEDKPRYFTKEYLERKEDKKETSKIDSDFLEYCIEQGLITKQELDTYTTAQTLLQILPKNTKEHAFAKLLIVNFNQKIKSLKELKKSFT